MSRIIVDIFAYAVTFAIAIAIVAHVLSVREKK